jgi:hypothetical protein
MTINFTNEWFSTEDTRTNDLDFDKPLSKSTKLNLLLLNSHTHNHPVNQLTG